MILYASVYIFNAFSSQSSPDTKSSTYNESFIMSTISLVSGCFPLNLSRWYVIVAPRIAGDGRNPKTSRQKRISRISVLKSPGSFNQRNHSISLFDGSMEIKRKAFSISAVNATGFHRNFKSTSKR